MKTSPRTEALAALHSAVFLFGFTAILGELIALHSFWTIWWRTLLAGLGFVLLQLFRKKPLLPTNRRLLAPMVLIGATIAVHWVLFYLAIRASNVSVTLVCLSSGGLMTAFLEPILLGGRLRNDQLVLGALTVLGITLIFSLDARFVDGILLGLAAALLSALWSVLNKRIVAQTDSYVLNLVQLLGGWLTLSVLLPVASLVFADLGGPVPAGLDWLWLGIFAWGTTTLPYLLYLTALRQLSAFTAVLAVNLETLYGVILAYFVFREQELISLSDPLFYVGSLLVVGSVALAPILNRRRRFRRAER